VASSNPVCYDGIVGKGPAPLPAFTQRWAPVLAQ